MFKNNLTIAFRQLSKNKSYTAINIFGLAVGIAASLLIWRILRYELAFNQNFAAHERVGRVVMRTVGSPNGDRADRGVTVPAMIEAQQKIDGWAATARCREDWPTISVPSQTGGAPLKKISAGDREVSFFVEPDFFKIFDLRWLAGGPANSFSEVGSTVLSQKTAEKLFDSSEKAIGKTIILDNNVPSIVRGVFENLPRNCDFPVYSLTSYATVVANKNLYGFVDDDWGSTSSNDQFYFLLKEKSQFQSLAPALAEIGKSHFDEAGKNRNMTARLEMQPLADWHFDEEIGSSATPTISRTRLVALGTIGLLVLAMACFNFINLATAMAASRSREVGVRKAIGGQKGALVAQFMTETGLITAFSVALGCFLAKAAAPFLKKISDVPDDFAFFSDPKIWLFLAAVGVAVALLSGLWPSFVLAGLAPIRALKSAAFSAGERGFTLRKGLVVAQFGIAQALLIGAVVTVSQLDFLQKMDIGVSKDLILNARFNNDSASLEKIDFLKRELLAIPTVESVSFSTDEPTSGSTWSTNFAFQRGGDEAFSTTIKFTDADFQKAYGLELAAGHFLEPSDTVKSYVVNEALLKKAGFTGAASEAVGQELRLGGGRFRTICGVVKDFHTKSAHARQRQNEPLVLACRKEYYSHLSIKIKPGDLPKTKSEIEKKFDAAFPEQVFDPRFFDETLAKFYEKEAQFAAFARAVALLAVLIGCLGLFGLASHTAAKRTKEIGVRKVLGATVGSLTGLLAKDFLKLVFVASVLAAPVAIFLMRKWLDDFAFRIKIEWWMVAATALGAVGVAFLTVSFQAIKAALADPVKSLRSE